MFTAVIKIPTIPECGQSAGVQGLWWWLGLSKDNRSEWNAFSVSWKLMKGLKAARIAAKLTIGQLAATSGVSPQTIWRFENFFNEVQHARLSTLLAIASGCDCALFTHFTDWPTAVMTRNDAMKPRPWNPDEMKSFVDDVVVQELLMTRRASDRNDGRIRPPPPPLRT